MRIGIRILLAAPRRLSGITALALILAAGCGGQAGDGGADAEPPAPVPAAEPTVAVETERVVYGKYEEQEITGLLARPVAGDGPAVVLIHDRWGLDENVEEMARRLAEEGFVALAVDLFGGQTATDPESGNRLVAAVADDPRAARHNLSKATLSTPWRTCPRRWRRPWGRKSGSPPSPSATTGPPTSSTSAAASTTRWRWRER